MKRVSYILSTFTAFLFIFLLPQSTLAQSQIVLTQKTKKIEIIHANTLIGIEKYNKKFRRLIGDVCLMHESVLMFCDSAYEYTTDNYFDAYGNIRIEQGDSIVLTGGFLHYDIKERTAYIEDSVTLTDRSMVLKTTKLIYNLKEKVASYTESAEIIDDENTLTSIKGYYHAETKDLFFRHRVRLYNVDFTMICDTLKYNIASHTAYFLSPTSITSEKTMLQCEDGWYNKQSKVSKFAKNAYIVTEEYKLIGDTLYYQVEKEIGEAIGNVKYIDKKKNTSISGQYGKHFTNPDLTIVTDSALGIKNMKNDTLYIHGDTLRLEDDSSGQYNIFTAYNDVSILSSQFQARCDSMVYATSDSVIRLFDNPVIWNEENQISAGKIIIFTKNDDIDKMLLENKAFLISKNDSVRFNQIKGREMIVYFDSNELRRINVAGNAEAIYYLTDDDKKYIGMDKITSSYIKVGLKDKKISSINFITAPTGHVEPPGNMDTPESKLKGFHWYEDQRPFSIEDLFK